MAATPPPASDERGPDPSSRSHVWRLVGIWVVLSAVTDPLFYFLAGPHIPPGTMASASAGAQFDFNVLLIIALPIVLGIWVYMAYALYTWRAARGGPEPVAGPYSRGHIGMQASWIGITSAIVIGLFVFGTVQLIVPAGAGGGEGPNPIWTPQSRTVLPVQVIGQQWKFTYRYPTFGGFETSSLVLPADTTIAFHVTSLDVIHSFWAYQLGVKADANPGQDNVTYTTTSAQLGNFAVHCSELCGLWHGSMFATGEVESPTAFMAWAKSSEASLAAATKLLPPFAYTYVPDANGADGGYYPDNVDPYSNVDVYGAEKAKT